MLQILERQKFLFHKKKTNRQTERLTLYQYFMKNVRDTLINIARLKGTNIIIPKLQVYNYN